MAKKAFDGIKVAGITYAGTANFVLRTLGMHGATVVRLESETRPCNLRVSGPFKDNKPGINRSTWFALYNNDRYSLALNLKHPKAPQVIRRLVQWADIFVENFTPGAMERLGLGYESVRETNPNVIMLSISLQGQTGPHRLLAGYGSLLQGLSGHDYLTGWPDRGPVLIDQSYPDFIAPSFACTALIAALHYRQRTGKGQYIDLSNYESAIHWLAPAILDYTVNDRVQMRCGNRVNNAAPHGAYPCKGNDAWCAIAIYTDEEWLAFCQVVGNPPWVSDPKFSTFLARKANEEELDKHVAEWTLNFTAEEVTEKMQRAGVSAGKVQTCEDVANNPQIKHRQYFRTLDHAEIGPYQYYAPSYKLSKTPAEVRLSFPLLGEHTEYVCRELLGMPEEEFVELLLDEAFK
ncbi:CaiB/BaiF CoA transferase family protein [Chloroflexota bacterium]